MIRLPRTALATGFALFAATSFAQAPAPAAPPAGPDWSKVEEKATDLGGNLFWIEGSGGNVTVAVGKDGLIVVDSQFAPLYPKLKAKLAELPARPVKYLINTHYHGDHTGGNEAFAKDGAVIVGQENELKRMAAPLPGADGKTPPAPPAAALPTKTYKDTLTLAVDGQTAKLIHPAPAHTDGDTIVWFERANVLATGDIFNSMAYPNIDVAVGGSINGMIAAVDQMLALVDDRTKIVPGHGPITNRAGLQEYRTMLVTVRDRVAAQIAAGKSEDEVFASKPFADLDKRWFLAGNRFSEMFPRLVYRSLKPSAP